MEACEERKTQHDVDVAQRIIIKLHNGRVARARALVRACVRACCVCVCLCVCVCVIFYFTLKDRPTAVDKIRNSRTQPIFLQCNAYVPLPSMVLHHVFFDIHFQLTENANAQT